MLIARLFDMPIAEWEEKIACASFLGDGRVRREAFAETAAGRIAAAVEKLELLPSAWAREICIAALSGNDPGILRAGSAHPAADVVNQW